jgi:hypothetical protein
MSLDFECLIQSLRLSKVSSFCFYHALSTAHRRLTNHRRALLHYASGLKLNQQCISDPSLQSDILIEEFVLVSKIPPDDFPIDSDVRESLAALF